MRVELIAETQLARSPGIVSDIERYMELDQHSDEAEDLIEFSGRACYQSFHKPNPQTEENRDYLANILNLGHESVLEHASATFYVQGVSRALTHELIRHRHLSFSELSQRFVNVEKAETVYPPAFLETDELSARSLADAKVGAQFKYADIAERLQNLGNTRKQAREAARSVLPNAIETKIVVTGNFRAWRDMLKKRWSVHADAEIREFAGAILAELRVIAPNAFQDIPKKPFGGA